MQSTEALVHRKLIGTWEWCEKKKCEKLFHFPGTTPEEMAMLPFTVLLDLIEAFDPPTKIKKDGTKIWSEPGRYEGKPHRSYDFPAVIEADGSMRWFLHGQAFRFGDRPAVVRADGLQAWYWSGVKHRKDPTQPAVIHPDGSQEFWHRGHRIDKPKRTSFTVNSATSSDSLPHAGFTYSARFR